MKKYLNLLRLRSNKTMRGFSKNSSAQKSGVIKETKTGLLKTCLQKAQRFLKKDAVTGRHLIDTLPQYACRGYFGILQWIETGAKKGTLFSEIEAKEAIALLSNLGYKESEPYMQHNARTEKEKADWLIGQAILYLKEGYLHGTYKGLPKRLYPDVKKFLEQIKRKEKHVC